jgi:hypothetical protein
MQKLVLIINSSEEYDKLFLDRGWGLAECMLDADLIQFTGGEDVSPELYGEKTYHKTFCNRDRDYRERLVFLNAAELAIPMAGICRGGQFLNVMCGGRMWQDINNHTCKHLAKDEITKEEFEVTSTHHQMMRMPKTGNVQVVLSASKTTERTTMHQGYQKYTGQLKGIDLEALFYLDKRCFCFQPHPEFKEVPKLGDRYIEYLEQFLFRKVH